MNIDGKVRLIGTQLMLFFHSGAKARETLLMHVVGDLAVWRHKNLRVSVTLGNAKIEDGRLVIEIPLQD